MTAAASSEGRTLDFLKIWNHVFAKNLGYVVDKFHADDSLKPDVIADADACQLGAWLNLERTHLQALPAFARLDAAHRDFHQQAGAIASRFRAGEVDAARQLVHGEFVRLSDAVDLAIDDLSDAMEGQGIVLPRFKQESFQTRETIWDESLEIGIPEVDRKHHAIAMLIDQVLVNRFITSASAETSRFIDMLTRLIRADIAEEQELLTRADVQVPDLAGHLAAHDNILTYLGGLRERLDQGAAISFEEVGSRMANWYIEHLVMHDLELAKISRRC